VKWTHSGIGNSRTRFLLALTTMLLVLSLSAVAQNNYYVSPSGSDSNNGTSPGTAWKTVNHAISSFSLGSGGAVIHVADGTYSENVSVNRGGSSPTARLVIQCDNGIANAQAAQGHCKFNGSGFAITGGGTANNYDIRGFDIGNNPNMTVGYDGLYCGSGTQSTCNNSVHIIGNYFHDLAQNAPLDSNGCVLLGHSPGAILILNQHNHFVTDTQVIGNIIFRAGLLPRSQCNTGTNGMYIDTKAATIQNNLIVQVHNWGMQVYGEDCDQIVTNNTVITAHFGMNTTGGGEGVCTSGHNTIANNILMNTLSNKIWGLIGCDSSHPNLIGNIITDGIGADFDRTQLSCSTITPMVHASGASLFVNYKTDGTGDYHLKAGSPADAAGTILCASGGITPCVPKVDISTLARSTKTPSIGVFEGATSGAALPSAPTGLTAQVQ